MDTNRQNDQFKWPENINPYSIMKDELEIIQNVINRMASNSFQLKGWTITLILGTFLLKNEETTILISLIPLFVFWYLDAYFLQKEKKYRQLYEEVQKKRLLTDDGLFNLDISKLKTKNILVFMLTKTIGVLYGSLLIIILLYFFISIFV